MPAFCHLTWLGTGTPVLQVLPERDHVGQARSCVQDQSEHRLALYRLGTYARVADAPRRVSNAQMAPFLLTPGLSAALR